MPQKTNLNVNPYYDDFDKDNNFYKVLFKPGYPVQARELTGLQSILQNQVESFGTHMFKEGSMVIPGGITCDNEFTTIKVNETHLGLDISIYLDALVNANDGKGTEVRGQDTDITATIKGYVLPPNEDAEDITLFIKYDTTAEDGETEFFADSEVLLIEENVTYGNTTLNAGDTILSLVANDASKIGYAVGVAAGVYFIRGYFVDVSDEQIVLDLYNNEPSYRVGFEVIEQVVNSDQDPSLNDNAKGYTNFAAPGADRLKISTRLTKKGLQDFNDTNFIELVKIDNGQIKKLEAKTEYNYIADYFAKRTFDESGNYAVDSFTVDVLDSLNNETGGAGLFAENQLTDEGNSPSEDLMCIKVSAGTAYVKGYDVDLVGSTIIDVPKPRTTKSIAETRVPFSMGSLIKVNNVTGVPYISIGTQAGQNTFDNVIELFDERRNSGTNNAGTGRKIGEARVYWYGVSDGAYEGATTSWDLYLFDIQTYTDVYVSSNINDNDVIPLGSYVRGLSSGARGYIDSKRSPLCMSLTQTSGVFQRGEQIIVNEIEEYTFGITAVEEFSVEDIKSVYQDSTSLDSNIQRDFIADTILYEKGLPDFSKNDKLIVTGGNTGQVPGRFFAGVTGIKTGAILKYQSTAGTDPNFNVISGINATGDQLTLTGPDSSVTGVCDNNVTNSESNFSLMVPKIHASQQSGLYSELPRFTVASVDLSDAELLITRQITGQSTDGNGEMTLTVTDFLGSAVGINSVFFEAFDAERYSIHYSNGTTEDLTSDQFTYGATQVTFKGLTASQSNVVVIGTLRKTDVTHKTNNYVKSNIVSVTRTNGKSPATAGLTTSKFYGLRIEDEEISLNTADVVDVVAVYESTNNAAPTLDSLTFATGLALDQNAIVGEKIVGQTSRAFGQVVEITATTVTYVPLNDNDFAVGEEVAFKSSSLNLVIQETTPGSYVDRTDNYVLDKAHTNQIVDYSRIRRRDGFAIPTKQLQIIYNQYRVSAGSTNSGDIFTVNSYTADRYKSDIPTVVNGTRVSDLLDFRPRVRDFDASTATMSPFTYDAREFSTNYRFVVTPEETTRVGLSYYLPRVDLVTINSYGQVEVIQGEPAEDPQIPDLADNAMEVALIAYPAYLFNPTKDPGILLRDNRRFTMRDIGKLEERIENLEEVTSLSLLELNTATVEVTDANGLNRFKSGFIVSDFKDKSLSDPRYTRMDINSEQNMGISPVEFWSMNAELAWDSSVDVENDDLDQNLPLSDKNIQKTGDLLTLAYKEVDFLDQPQATNVENVNPFNVIVYVGGVQLTPPADNWTRTIYINHKRTESTGAKWVQEATVHTDVDKKVEYVTYKKGRGRNEKKTKKFVTTTTTKTTTYKPKLVGPSKEFDYVENVKITSTVDPFMRSREVYFLANGLKPDTKHYHFLDSQQVDIIPKLVEIDMQSGTFQKYEKVDIFKGGKKIGHMKLKEPNNKFGNKVTKMGVMFPPSYETYSVNPYDKKGSAPPANYSATSKLLNFDLKKLASSEEFYGYITKGCKIVGKTSGAVAKVKNFELITDNWGDIVACFHFRDPNKKPAPPVKVKSGTKTVKVTAVPPGVTPIPGSTTQASEAIGTYSGTGTIDTVENFIVQVRNPPKPKAKKTEVEVTVKAPHRDPLAQTFLVDGTGVFLTSFDLFFAKKDPKKKLFVELRTVELGTPTNLLVQDFTQIALNPNDIETSDDASKATTVRFPSPVYLEAGREYAIVILAPSSDKYEMWTATMGQKTVQSAILPNSENVVVSKQYIGGSLFKSQNGTIWTPSQYQDLTFKLRKAEFVEKGTLIAYNSGIGPKGSNSSDLPKNPIELLPRKLKVRCSGSTAADTTNFTPGTMVGVLNDDDLYGFIEKVGGGLVPGTSSGEIANPGIGYSASADPDLVSLYTLTGKGSGATAKVTTNASGEVTEIDVLTRGEGYAVGDLLGITTAHVQKGSGAIFAVNNIGVTSTLYLNNVQGEHFPVGVRLQRFTTDYDLTTKTSGSANFVVEASSIIDDKYDGNVMKILQYNHAHHGANNDVEIVDVEPDREKVKITANLGKNATVVSVADTTPFATYEGISTSGGYAKISNEIVEYDGITNTSGNAGTLTIVTRGVDSTTQSAHSTDDFIQPYEIGGVNLRRINTTHDLPATYYTDENDNIDHYHLRFERSTSYSSRDVGGSRINFTGQKAVGGNSVGISQNYQFSSLTPQFNYITPGKGTKVKALVRTISGTSAGGNEVSFIDQGYDPITLNKVKHFETPRLVASKINEREQLTTLPRNKSLTLRVDFSTEDKNLSPVMDIQNATWVLGRNKINHPVDDYVMDSRTNTVEHDPHSTVLVTRMTSLEQPATSLKVLIAACVEESADIRVLYRLHRADSAEIDQSFIPFPGYDNTKDTDGDGFGDQIIDITKNSGRPDAKMTANDPETFSEYQFSVNNLEQFDGFSIKVVTSSTNESTPVKLKDFRCIALA